MPATFYANRNVSFIELVRDVGIWRHRRELTRDAIASALRAHPELIDSWLLWSMNKRTGSGWYFEQQDDGYVVGYFPKGQELRFEDIAVGCTEFILREVSAICALTIVGGVRDALAAWRLGR